MMGLPTLQVLLDDGTGTFPYDISAYVLATDGYEVTRGREDWQGAVTAGELTLTLNNSDGRFSPGSTIIHSPSPIVVDQKIRLVEGIGTTPGVGFGVGGFGSSGFGGSGSGATYYTRFTGYVKAWPVSWPATVSSFSEVRVTAVDAQARAERRVLRSLLEEDVLVSSPTTYYTLGEAAGSVAAGDTSSQQANSLTVAGSGASPIFGTARAPGLDGLTACQFLGGKYLLGPVANRGNFITPTIITLSCWFTTTTSPGPSGVILASYNGWQLGVDYGVSSGSVYANGAISSGLIGTNSVIDGQFHHAAVTSDGTTVRLYIDGVQVATAGTFALPSTQPDSVGGGLGTTTSFTGTISHVSTYSSALSAAKIAAQYAAGVGAAETDTARLTRVAGYAGLTVGTFDSSLTTVPASPVSGSSAQDAIQAATDAALGLSYIDSTGALTFHNRNRVPAKTSPDLTLTSQWVTPDVNPVVDDQQIVNYFETTAQGTGSTRSVLNGASQTSHGRYPTSATYLVQTDQEALDRANWIVANFAEPTTRYGTLTINLYGMTTTQQSTVLAALDLDCWLRVTGLATQTPGGTTADVIVQALRETVSADTWTITCNVVARSLYSPTWQLGTSTLDTNTRLYV